MRKLLIVVLLAVAASMYAQENVVKVLIGEGETCPAGWTTTDRSWTRPEKVFYVLPASLVAAFQRTTIGSGPAEYQVTPAFVAAVFPTDAQRQAAYTSGRLRSEPAESGIARTCTLP